MTITLTNQEEVTLQMILSWNKDKVFFTTYQYDHQNRNLSDVGKTVSISSNPHYIKWLEDNKNDLFPLFIGCSWYESTEHHDVNHYYKELQHFIREVTNLDNCDLAG